MSAALRFARLSGRLQQQARKNPLPAVLGRQPPSASIVSIAKQDESFERPPPFNYKKKTYYRLYTSLPFLEPTTYRMNENSKVITVEGNIGSKKSELAAALAKELGMKHIPEPRIDDLYVNGKGFDYRTLNQYIDPKLHAIDEKMFYENPQHPAVSWLKMYFYRIKYKGYIDAMAHLFNTGEGVILERSPFSDFVFADAMHQCGHLPADAYDYYFRLRYDTIHDLLRPHLVIYLDEDVDTCLKNIKEKNIPWENNGKVLTREYLQEIEDSYKDKYLPDIEQFSSILTYRRNDVELEDIVSDIGRIDFSHFFIGHDQNKGVLKYRDWHFFWIASWHYSRYLYTTNKLYLLGSFDKTPVYDTDSLWVEWNDIEHQERIFKSFVPNYGIEPQFDSMKMPYWKTLFKRANWWEIQEFRARHPWY